LSIGRIEIDAARYSKLGSFRQAAWSAALKPTNWILAARANSPTDQSKNFEHIDRFPHKPPRLALRRNGLARIPSMLQRVFIATRSARSWRAAMHPTPFLSGHRGRHAGRMGARSVDFRAPSIEALLGETGR
jgi:hypothetical protein